MEPMDIHSWSRPDLIRVRHLELNLDVRFDRRVLEGSVTLMSRWKERIAIGRMTKERLAKQIWKALLDRPAL